MKEKVLAVIKECEMQFLPMGAQADTAKSLHSEKEKYMLLKGFLLGLIADDDTPINRDGGE